MRRASAISLVALLLVSSRVKPQQQSPTGVIEGTIVRSDTGEPISGAQVMLMPAYILPIPSSSLGAVTTISPLENLPAPGVLQPIPEPTTVLRDSDGKFSFKNLRGRGYQIAAAMSGFANTQYGKRTLNAPGRPLFLNEGQIIGGVVLRMTPTGTISGRIFDDRGQAATGAPVQLLRGEYSPQGKSYPSASQVVADDRGDYRFYGVPPGRYFLVAGNPPGPSRVTGVDGRPLNAERYSLVYYPSASTIEQASMVEVKPGEETSFDFRVQRLGPGYRVKGRIMDGTGKGLPTNPQIMLAYRGISGGSGSFSSGRNFDPATGAFEMLNVPPGDYTLQVQVREPNPPRGTAGATDLLARQATQAAQVAGTAGIRVVDRDIEGVVLTLTPAVSLGGRFIVEGQPPSAIRDFQQVMLVVQPIASALGSNPTTTPVASDGTFQIAGLRDGEYRVSLRSLPTSSSFYVQSIRYGGDDVLSKTLKFSGAGSGEVEVLLRAGSGQISGMVLDARSEAAAGVQVFAIPMDRTRLYDYKQTFTDQNGRYSLPSLAPGDYRLFSWESIESFAHYDPDFVQQYEQQGKIVHVPESSSQNVDVRLIPNP